jgi:ethanolaminephosphotransferase
VLSFHGLVFSPLSLASYINVFKARRASGGPVIKPLLYLLPFPATVLLHVAWLNHPFLRNSDIMNSPAFVPFLCAWGLEFAHVVGRMIIAHVTSQPFPVWDSMYIWSIVGAIDANMPILFGR